MHLSHAGRSCAEIRHKGRWKLTPCLDKDSGPPIVRTDPYYDVLVPRRLVDVRNRARIDKAKSKEAKP